jgi:3-keto-5-aminohexanoate cleavage enzyme
VTAVGEAIVLRPAEPADRSAILDVMRSANMHRVPSAEMAELDLERFFVACVDGRVVGAAGWTLLPDGQGKTTLLAVLPEFTGDGIGARLQDARLEAMLGAGATTVTTNADRPVTINWYRRRYGYRVVGSLTKQHEFGDPSVDRWTTLRMDLTAWARRRSAVGGAEGPAVSRDDPADRSRRRDS